MVEILDIVFCMKKEEADIKIFVKDYENVLNCDIKHIKKE